jgi:predicted phage replisome organizer
MPNGKDYILFYLKLLCESVDHEGNLRFSENIPYNAEMLSVLTNTNIDIVRSAIKTLTALNMMEILDDETIYMTAVEKMTGSETEWADKKRSQRERKRLEAKEDNVLEMSSECPDNVPDMSRQCPTEKETDSEQEQDPYSEADLERETDSIEKKNKKKKSDPVSEFEPLLSEYLWTEEMKDTIRDWIRYKTERNEYYKPTSRKTLLKQVDKAITHHGETTVEEAILNAMANNYQGMGLDRIPTNGSGRKNTQAPTQNEYLERLKNL